MTTSGTTARRLLRKRSVATTDDGRSESFLFSSDLANLVKCAICWQPLEDPCMPPCGDTFCRRCILEWLRNKNSCPSCRAPLDASRDLFPNKKMRELVGFFSKMRRQEKLLKLDTRPPEIMPSDGSSSSSGLPQPSSPHLQQPHPSTSTGVGIGVATPSASCVDTASLLLCKIHHQNMDLSTICSLIDILHEKRDVLQKNDQRLKDELLLEFLRNFIDTRTQKIEALKDEVSVALKDQQTVKARLNKNPDTPEAREVPNKTDGLSSTEPPDDSLSMCDATVGATENATFTRLRNVQDTGNLYRRTLRSHLDRLRSHTDELEKCYLSCRTKSVHGIEDDDVTRLDTFRQCMDHAMQFSGCRVLASLNYNVDMYNSLNIVSSIEFDKDSEYFAVAGVIKKIKLYEYSSIVEDVVDIHYPIGEMQCTSKISCLSWNPFQKNLLASSDYEGIVQLWDPATLTSIRKYQEHEKRCWSVNFNAVDHNLFASGSDDAKVKLWDLNEPNSIHTLEAKVNVCCVHFNPSHRHHLAFGSADHCVHYYDLRQTKQALKVCRGHKKAVSYVKFSGPTELISASTDSHLRLWNLGTGHCERTFVGHQNEKNFVGMTTDGNYMACGSENNSLYVYYKGISKPLITYAFDSEAGLLERERSTSDNQFVSAVCWKKGSSVVAAANSLGMIRILEMT